MGVILAAGRGRRMGRTKQLVDWPTANGKKPLVAAAYDAVRPVCAEIVVVLGHEALRVAAALDTRPFHPADSDPDAPMFESIRAGLRAALALDREASILLQPGDHPEVAKATLEQLVESSRASPTIAIIPQYQGQGGHPVLIPPSVAALLIDADCPQGLGQFWTDHPDLCRRVGVDDASMLRDIDTADELPG